MAGEFDISSVSIMEEVALSPVLKLESRGVVVNPTAESTDKIQRENVHFKILVPYITAGAIIGKGGEAITEVQNKTSAKVKMSKANDFYPGTTERVCLIIGTVKSILQVFEYISAKIYEKPETLLRVSAKVGGVPTERHKQVKILVPNTTAGLIIGKYGTFINEVKHSTGVFIQVSQRSKQFFLPERCVIIAGELSQTREAVKRLLVKIAEDPQSSSFPNISYAKITEPVANSYPFGSPYAVMSNSTTESPEQLMVGTNNPMEQSGAKCFRDLTTPLVGSPFVSISSPGCTSTSSMFEPNSQSAFAATVAVMGASSSFASSGNSAPTSTTHNAAGRALTGRGGTTAHFLPRLNNHTESLLGCASEHFGGGSVGSISSTYNPSISPPPGPPIGLDAVRNTLRSAGYSSAATEEIANAMQVLSLYGFISMSSLAGATHMTKQNNSESFTVVKDALRALNHPIANYVSTNSHSPGSFTEADANFLNLRSFDRNSTAYTCQPVSYFPSNNTGRMPIQLQNDVTSCLAPITAAVVVNDVDAHVSVHDTTTFCRVSEFCAPGLNTALHSSVLSNGCDNYRHPTVPSYLGDTDSLSNTRPGTDSLVNSDEYTGADSAADCSVGHDFFQHVGKSRLQTEIRNSAINSAGAGNGLV